MSENSKILHCNDDNLESSIGDGVVLVDFFATWCGPCRRLGPILEELANDVDDIKIIKVDTDQAKHSSSKYSVSSLPTLILFKDGQEVDRSVGLMDLDSLKDFITSA